MSAQAGMIAKTGLSMLYNATVTSVSAISDGINKAYKSYNDHYEKNQLESLRKAGKPPSDVLHQVLMRFYYLSEAGYNNELAAAAQKIAAKLTSGEKSAVSPECVGALSSILVSSCSKYGEFSSGGWGLSDFLNSARMGKDHFDRDQIVSDFYFAVLYAQDLAGGPGAQFENYIRDAAAKMVEGEAYVSTDGAPAGGTGWASFGSGGLPSYAKAGGFGSTSAGAKPATTSTAVELDPKKKRAKVLSAVSLALKKAADEAEGRRVRSLKEAEEMLAREKAKAAQAAGLPAPTPMGASFGSTTGGFGSGAGSSSFGTTKPATGFGSSTFGGAPAAGSSGFGGYGAPAAAAAPAAKGFGSSGAAAPGWGGGSSSGFGGGSGSGGGGWGSSGGTGASTGSGFGSGGMMGFGGGGYSTLSATSSDKSNQGGFGGSLI